MCIHTTYVYTQYTQTHNLCMQCVCLYIMYAYNVYIYTSEYYSPIKKAGDLPFATTRTDLKGIALHVISQRDKYYMTSLTCGI